MPLTSTCSIIKSRSKGYSSAQISASSLRAKPRWLQAHRQAVTPTASADNSPSNPLSQTSATEQLSACMQRRGARKSAPPSIR